MLISFAAIEGWNVAPITASNICQKVGWLSPFYLCPLLDQTLTVARDRIEESRQTLNDAPKNALIITDVIDTYERILSARSRFVHWEFRLTRDLAGLTLKFALTVLAALAKNTGGLTRRQLSARLAKLESDSDQRAEQLQNTLLKLEEEGYISPPDETGKIVFLSFLLRDYWSRNHG